MTSYSAIVTVTGATASLSLKAVTYQMRIVSIETTQLNGVTSQSFPVFSVTKYNTATQSGGSTVVPGVLREGAAAALASVKSGATTSGSSSFTIHKETNILAIQAGINPGYKIPFDVIVNPGSALVAAITGANTDQISTVTVFFEELHLARSV